MAAAVRIRVGAAIDQSFDAVMRTMEQATVRAQRRIAQGSQQTARAREADATKASRTEQREAEKLAKAYEKANQRIVNDFRRRQDQSANLAKANADREAKAAEQAAERKAKADERAAERKIRAAERANDRITRKLDQEARAERALEMAEARRMNRQFDRDRAMVRRDSGQRANARAAAMSSMASGALRGAIGLSSAALAKGASIASESARGAGIDFDVGSAIKQASSLESTATQISNSGYMPGKDRNGQRVDPRELIAQARMVGNATAYDPTEVLGGLQKFVAKTGDLQSGRDALKDLSVLSKATGTNFEDMLDAAGDVSNALGDTDNKGEKIKAVMQAIAAQGKEGAVEIKDLAVQMAKLGAASTQFEGDHVKNIQMMGVLTQMTRAQGGAASATQAATSISSFTNTFSKGARLDAFENFGVKVQGKTGKVRAPQEIIIDALRAAGSDRFGGMKQFDRNMGSMFMDVRARSAVRGWENVYKDAGGGEKGVQAVREEFDRLAKSTMTQIEIDQSFAEMMRLTESQTQILNNQFNETAGQLKDSLVPALISAAPAVIAVTNAFAGLVEKFTGYGEKKRGEQEYKDTADLGNATGALREESRSGHVKKAHYDAVQAKVDRENKAIAVKEMELEKLRKKPGMRDIIAHSADNAWTNPLLKPLAHLAAAGADKALGFTDAEQSKIASEERGLKTMKDKAGEAEVLLSGLKGFFGESRISVVIEEDKTATKPVPTVKAGEGREVE